MDVTFYRINLLTLCLLVLLQLSACGGGGGGGSVPVPDTTSGTSSDSGSGDTSGSSNSGGTNTGTGTGTGGNSSTEPAGTGSTIQTGHFIDGPVAGLTYLSISQSGMTDVSGTYQFITGETISFYLGDILLGTTTATGLITPVSLVPDAVDETDITVSNISRFLQSLDHDADPSNGIEINSAVTAAAAGKHLDFSAPDFETLANLLLAELTTGIYVPVRTLIDSTSAQQHLRENLLQYLAGAYEGVLGGDDSGTWRLVLGIDGSLTGTLTGNSLGRVVVSGNVLSDGEFNGVGPAGSGTLQGKADLQGVLSGTYMPTSSVTVTLSGVRVELPAVIDPVTNPTTDPTTNPTTDPTTGNDPGSSTGTGTVPGPVNTIPLGHLDIQGSDTAVVGTQFIPDQGFRGVNAIQYKVDGGNSGFTTGLVILNLTADNEVILATFSWANGNKSVAATVTYTYTMNCPASGVPQPDDCSTIVIDPIGMSVSFNNALMENLYADAKAPLMLSGTLNYEPLP